MRKSLPLAFLFCHLIVLPAFGGDWPTFQHDAQRSGITAERLGPELHEQWVFVPTHAPAPAWGDPQPKPVQGYLEMPRVRFDDTFQVAVVGGNVTFASSADGTVTCLAAGTGRVRWRSFTGGPVRLAPTVWKGKVYVGSDDGFVYCLNADDGRQVWKFHAAPHDDLVLGHGKLISLWPVRTGVLIKDGIAYFGAGLFPGEGVLLYAVRAETGKVLWKNDTFGNGGRGRISPQGYLLASEDRLFVASGRCIPAAFDPGDGRFLFQPSVHHTVYDRKLAGGTYALLSRGQLFSGTEQLFTYSQQDGKLKHIWLARRVVATDSVVYLATDTELIAVDRKKYPKAEEYPTLVGRQRAYLMGQLKRYEYRLARNTRKGRVHTLEKLSKTVADLKRQLAPMHKKAAEMDRLFGSTVQWRLPAACPDAAVLAGKTLVAGGEDLVVAVNVSTGRKLWTHKVDGRAKGLAVAGGRLFVSTDKGNIHCFGRAPSARSSTVRQKVERNPYPDNERTRLCRKTAETILRETGIKRGYALVLGGGTGSLGFELARRSDLMVYVVEPDSTKAAASRRTLSRAGLYGARVTVHHGSLASLPHPDYFANLIVCQDSLLSGTITTPPEELLRMLKPLGGTAYIGQPAGGKPLDPDRLRKWLKGLPQEHVDVRSLTETWAKLTRRALPGAGNWTHQYANSGNTACGDDTRVKGPLGVLWFGEPGPGRMPNRHVGAAGPLSLDGRLFVQGENVVMAYDIYNGLKLWERDIPGASRAGVKRGDVGNLAVSTRGLFVVVGETCLLLDVRTGTTLKTFRLPPSQGEKPYRWGYVATVGNRLFGCAAGHQPFGSRVFAFDVDKQRLLWSYPGKRIQLISIAVGGGRLYLVDNEVTPEQQRQAAKATAGKPRLDRHGKPVKPDVRLVVALNAATGDTVWKKPMDVSDCVKIGGDAGGELSVMYGHEVLLLAGQPWNGHFWKQFLAGEFDRRSLIALAADTGRDIWSGHKGYRSRPLLVGKTIYAEPWAYDLLTGKPKGRVHPITGRESKWQMCRPGHHCGPIAAGPNCLFFRSSTTAYYDLTGDYGTVHFGAQRPGCWINFIPAGGLLLMPEASSGCLCPYAIHCTVVFRPRKVNRVWGTYSAAGEVMPVKHLAINFGAPGDRRDASGRLWLAYPRPYGGKLLLKLNVPVHLLKGGGYFRQVADQRPTTPPQPPWLFASGVGGAVRVVVPLAEKGTGPRVYTVRLYFAEPKHDRPGRRVFDIRVQNKPVLRGFDIVRAAGGREKPVVREFTGIRAGESLTVDLVPKVSKPTLEQSPLLNGIEVIRADVP